LSRTEKVACRQRGLDKGFSCFFVVGKNHCNIPQYALYHSLALHNTNGTKRALHVAQKKEELFPLSLLCALSTANFQFAIVWLMPTVYLSFVYLPVCPLSTLSALSLPSVCSLSTYLRFGSRFPSPVCPLSALCLLSTWPRSTLCLSTV
jgi:hypothetical protein